MGVCSFDDRFGVVRQRRTKPERNVRAPLERHAGNTRPRATYPVKAREDQCHRDDTPHPSWQGEQQNMF